LVYTYAFQRRRFPPCGPPGLGVAMNFLQIFLIAVGLSMDAVAVAVASSLAARARDFRPAFRMALAFGLFQALMPLLGWLAGMSLRSLISGLDHWVAFGLLVFVGGKMLVESFRSGSAAGSAGAMRLPTLLLLALATSIDALAVGLSLSFLHTRIVGPALLIGAVTFVLSLAGGLLGARLGTRFGRRIEALGGLILIGIGIKILVEHLN
jgi:putative Mn2+ efflux pump MntP